MSDNSDFFSGNFNTLRKYWNDKDRALKFRGGGTRAQAVGRILQRHEVDIHNGIWLDIATGAGYVQSQLSEEVSPVYFIGIDMSEAMLRSSVVKLGDFILGTSFKLPLRKNCIDIATNFFSLSDYPSISDAFCEMARVIKFGGIMSHTDYSDVDDYWRERQKHHGEIINGKKITGNIHLRNHKEIQDLIPSTVRVVYQELLEIEIDTKNMNENFDLPDKLMRRFIFTEAYKPIKRAS